MTRYAMAVDVDRCLGCEACLVACSVENRLPLGSHRLRIRETATGAFPDVTVEFRVEQCFHCAEAPCVGVCPTGATFKTDDGIVLVDPDRCTGCKACVTACPYGMRYVHPRGYVDKCTFCEHRRGTGRDPACVETCPAGARVFGDLDDPDSPVSEAIAAADRVDVLFPNTDAEPSLFYLNARLVNTLAETAPATVTGGEHG
ncbi:MAG: 4Fe-4S dicluster domain-containing protein [Acidimicrobiia bacterium]|nr:4Fe-4S dicluster domain-containing protein [Acidimicrobiia bacterium]